MPSTTNAGSSRRSPLNRLSDELNKWCERLMFVFLILMTLTATAQVVFRFFFTALSWSEELSCFLLVFVSVLGAAIAFKRGSHLSITFLSDRLSPMLKKLVATCVSLLGIGFFGIVAYYGAVLMQSESGQLTPAMQISMTWIYLMYPIFGFVTVIHLLDGMIDAWKGAAS
ncbi:MAG: TRAP transporter small permease [Treponemataceae bacterium]